MTSTEIKSLFSNNKSNEKRLPIEISTEINEYVQMNMEYTDDVANPYMLTLNVVEMSKNDMPEELIHTLLEYGWTLSPTRDKIIKRC